MPPPTGPGPGARRIAAGLFGLSFSTALFTLSIFKLLSFFIMPSLFFDLLFIGFPIGGFLAARWSPDGRRSPIPGLWALQAMMALSVVACLAAKRFDYLRAHLFDIELAGLIGQIAAFSLLFLPFFAASGLAEYLGYQYGRSRLGGRMRAVYALTLFGAAAAYIFLKLALPPLGMARIQMLAFLGAAGSTLALAPGRASRALAMAEAGALGIGLLVPGVEGAFLALYKGRGILSTSEFRDGMNCRPAFQRWGRYSLTEILEAPDKNGYFGFYNDMYQWEYDRRMGFSAPSLGAVPILGLNRASKAAIIGAGGGRQVRLASRAIGCSVVALEIEPAVFEAVRGKDHLLEGFDRVYEAPGVRPVRAEARGYFERTDERFDLIYLPSVGGYAQMMIEPGNMIRTFEAHRLLRDHLTDRGLLAIWYPLGLDTVGVLTDQYVRTLRALGMPAEAYRNASEWLILAPRDPATRPPSAGALTAMLRIDRNGPGAAAFLPARHLVADDPRFVPIVDDRPFLAGNVRYILSVRQVGILFGLAAGTLGLVLLAAWLGLRRRGDPGIPGRPFAAVGVLAILIGANFLLVEHALVLGLFRKLFVYDDALTLAIVAFLAASGLGSLVGSRVGRPWVAAAAAAGLATLATYGDRLSVAGMLAAAAPIAMATGTFFPSLFERSAANPLAVFALDAIGAGFGAVLSTFVPILGGFSTFFAVAGAVFVATLAIDARFHRDRPPPGPA